MTERIRTTATSLPPIGHVPAFTVKGSTQHGYAADPNPLPYGEVENSSMTKTTIDTNNGDFRKRSRMGEIINTHFKSTTVTQSARPVGPLEWVYYKKNGLACALHTPGQTHDWYTKVSSPNTAVFSAASGGGFLAVDAVLKAELRQRVIDLSVAQAFSNIDESEMLALAAVAESGKTVQSVQAILFRAYKILKNVRHLNVKALRQELSPKELADRYMEARYAIRPLMYDVRGMVRAVRKEKATVRRTYRGKAEDSTSASATVLNVDGIYLTKMDFLKTVDYSVTAKAGVLCDVTISELSIYGCDQFVETLWELAPWSFIADWFANIGDVIAAHTPNAGVRQLASWVTVKETTTQSLQVTDHRSNASASGFVGVSLTSPKGTIHREELVLERIVNPAISSFPSSKMRLDGYKLIDLAIILRNLFAK